LLHFLPLLGSLASSFFGRLVATHHAEFGVSITPC
jgi:hypothetical protein